VRKIESSLLFKKQLKTILISKEFYSMKKKFNNKISE
jgi:hypothetical protein